MDEVVLENAKVYQIKKPELLEQPGVVKEDIK